MPHTKFINFNITCTKTNAADLHMNTPGKNGVDLSTPFLPGVDWGGPVHPSPHRGDVIGAVAGDRIPDH